ncbi:MAG: hypothetical protein JNM36_17705 [Chitinophagales bacterium]|jgi:hypothetical protein|nr:hypothetical protein [Chitinophagales bacterium]
MEKILVLLNLAGLSFSDLVLKAQNVAKKIDENANDLPNVTPTSAELRAESQAINALLEREQTLKSDLGGVQQELKMRKSVLQNMLKSAGTYVESVANQKRNPSLVEKVGFAIRQQGTTTNDLDVPLHLRLLEIPNTSGALQIVFDPVSNARNYGLIWYYGEVSPAEWSDVPMKIIASSRNNKLKLERGKTVWVRVKAYGPNDTESDWSDVASRIVP